jgi:hypothetical protein
MGSIGGLGGMQFRDFLLLKFLKNLKTDIIRLYRRFLASLE